MMTIDVSAASCERGFLQLNIEKTSFLSRMNSQILSGVMLIDISSTSLDEFNPEQGLEEDIQKDIKLHKSRCDKPELVETIVNFITDLIT